MRKIATFSILLIAGLIGSQIFPVLLGPAHVSFHKWVTVLTMIFLSYIMIHVGFEFTIDKNRLSSYGWDYLIAMTTAAFPWIFCALYFIYVLPHPEGKSMWYITKESLLASRFAAPTSAGVLFSMLAAAGLGASWLFKKARILAIFDDLDTILLMIPLKAIFIGFQSQLVIITSLIGILLWIAWRYLHTIRLPDSWPWVMLYSFLVTLFCKCVDSLLAWINPEFPSHFEVLLPAFVLGSVIIHQHAESEDSETAALGLDNPTEKWVATIVSAIFMILVGLSMPPLMVDSAANALAHISLTAKKAHEFLASATAFLPSLNSPSPILSWGEITVHVILITLLSNLGKMFPAFCYREEASWRERLALAFGMCPRGEVGAGVLLVAVQLKIDQTLIVVAMLSLALNLVLTGGFIWLIKVLLNQEETHSRPA